MIYYIIKRVTYSILVLFGVLSVVFLLFNVLPGDPARMMLDKREDSVQLAAIKNKYGFDKPIIDQYMLYLNDVSPISIHNNSDIESFTYLYSGKYTCFEFMRFSNQSIVLKYPYLRESFSKPGKSVSSVIIHTFPNTFVLAASSILIALILGLSLGIFSALLKDSFLDRSIIFFSVFGMSLPSFLSSIIIAWIFGFLLHDYTGLDMTGSLYYVDDYGRGKFLQIQNLILPAITLAIRPLSVIIQLARNSLLDVLSMDYIRTARAKGLSSSLVILKHALKNSLNPVVTVVSGWFASLLAGAVFVEYIFAWNGLGKEIVDALYMLDLPVVMGAVLFISTLFVIINILVDLTYAMLDPRIRTQ